MSEHVGWEEGTQVYVVITAVGGSLDTGEEK